MQAAPKPMVISVVVPTLNRPEPLERALRSLEAQHLDKARDIVAEIEVLVVDNSADRNAQSGVETIAQSASIPIRYVSEPVAGVSSARNRGVAEAGGAYIAFLDDDEEASPQWLAKHLTVLRTTGADASFGPVVAKPEAVGPAEELIGYFERHLDRADEEDITELAAYLGTNNSVFSAACFEEDEPFATELNQFGGEDSLLLQKLVRGGRRLCWSAEASVIEWVPARRLTWAYVHRRKYLSGQIRCFVLAMLSPPAWVEVAKWMSIGAAQTAGFGLAALIARPFSSRWSKRLAATAFGGLGKVLWMKRFRPQLYGQGLVS